MPVTSVIHMDARCDGLRYLHCNLCESEWYVMQAECIHCGQNKSIHHWTPGTELSAAKAESCDGCGCWSKLLYQEKDPAVEPVADDLASLVLDARMEQEGFFRTSLNPFMFPDK